MIDIKRKEYFFLPLPAFDLALNHVSAAGRHINTSKHSDSLI